MLYVILAFFGLAMAIAAIAQWQKRGHDRFYPSGSGVDAPYDGPEPPVVPRSFPLNRP